MMGDAAAGPARGGRTAKYAPIAAAALAVLVLGGYLGTGLLLDDSFHLARAGKPFGFEALDYAIRTADHRIQLWAHPEPVAFKFFRPLSALSLWLERRLWGPHVWGYHLTNVLLHLANAWLLARLAARCGLAAGLATLGALAWALSLQVIPSVGWISGRTEVLWGTCALVAAHALLRWRDGGGAAWLGASLAASALAACAKETGLVSPLLGLLAMRFAKPAPAAAPARTLTPLRAGLLLVPSLAVLAARLASIGLSLPPEPYLDVPRGVSDAMWTALKPGLYLAAGWLSLPLSHWGPLEWIHVHPWALALLVPAGVLATVAAGRAAGRPALLLWLGWFAVALLPVMPIRPTSLYLYVPMMGLTMLVAAAFQGGRRPAFAAWLAIMVVVGGGSHLFIQRFIARVCRESEAQVATLDRWLHERRATRLVAIDTPVWLYALPATIALESPDVRIETWFLNFKPRLDAVAGSSVRWRNALELEVTAPPGGFLHSTFERFLAFGGTPPERPAPAGRPVEVAIEGPRANPARLLVTFRDASVRDSTLVVRFAHDGLRPVEPPPGARSPRTGAGAAPRGETTAPGPTR